MSKPRVTATDQLSNVIEVVELGQRTGLLSVERGSGSVLEEGEIYFVSGRAIYAGLAGLRGREALAAMSRWGACRFSFDRDAPRPTPNLTNPQQQAVQPPSAGRQSPAPNMGSSWPHLSQSQPGAGAPLPRGNDGSGSWPGVSGGGANGGYGRPAYPSGTFGPQSGGAGGQPGYPTLGGGLAGRPHSSDTGQLGMQRPAGQGYPQQGQASQAALARRPRRAPDVRDLMIVVNTHNLSRSHRTILLLADGEHTVLDLARLSSKPADEVVGLLEELEGQGLIYYYE